MQDVTPHPVSFGLSSEQCELLLAFESAGSMADLARVSRRDLSVISRQLQRIARTAPVLEKQDGKWRLSPLGIRLNHWTRDAMEAQKRLLERAPAIRIASTREFAARVLGPGLAEILDGIDATVNVLTSEKGIEKLLLTGKADIGFDCGRPQDPSLRFRLISRESFTVVASPDFLRASGVATAAELIPLAHLRYKRVSAPTLLKAPFDLPNVLATFDDIATIREACVAGLGWAILPTYSVRRELDSARLLVVPGWDLAEEQFGVWWVRARKSVEPWVERAIGWLKRQTLC